MGRAIKRMLIGAAALFVIGILMCTISVVAGVNTSNVTIMGRDKTNYVDFDQTFTQSITSLDVEFYCGKLYVKKGDVFRVEAKDVPENRVNVNVESDGTLKISEKRKNWLSIDAFPLSMFGINGKRESTITIYVPDNTTFKKCKIEIGAGKAVVDDITAETAELNLSAGQIEANNLKIQKSTKIEVGAGSMKLSETTLNNCNMDISAGELEVEGRLTGKTEAECGAGTIKIKTDLEEKDYNYDCDASAGSIKVNGDNMKHNEDNNNAENSFDLNCSAGQIKITTK